MDTTVPTLLVVGTGALARAVCVALAADARRPLRVVVTARNPAAAADLAVVGRSAAAVRGLPVTFDHLPVPGLRDAVTTTRPTGVLVAASYQSPWEKLDTPSAWTDLLAAGFGASLPLQAALVGEVAHAVADTGRPTWVVNACFPDAVNPLLAQAGRPVLCGVGNVATLTGALQEALGRPDPDRLHVLAHHVHLADPPRRIPPDAPAGSADEARAWLDGVELAGLTDRLAPLRRTHRPRTSHLIGATAARLLLTLLHGGRWATSVPGPAGLPGGYPVLIDDASVTLRLPDSLTRAQAVAFNEKGADRDGVSVRDGAVTFAPAVADLLASAGSDLAGGFAVADLGAATTHLLDLRARLRARPAIGGPP